jgi:hypothetical protein
MRTGLRALLTGVIMSLASAGVAHAAADYCIDVQNGVDTLALKAFAAPGKGRCVEARGFYAFGPLFANGAACTASDGKEMVLVLTAAVDDVRQIHRLQLDLPSAVGTGRFCTADTGSGGGCTTFAIERAPCTPATVPVP